MTETADVVERRRFRCDYIDKHSLKDFKWLLQAVAHDDVDIRYMDKKLAEIVYER